jgi:hypothetical protein
MSPTFGAAKKDVRKAIGKEEGDAVVVRLEERAG